MTRSAADETGGVTVSPDGSRIAFVRDGDLWTMGANPADAAKVTGGALDPAWSPDGTRIAFTGTGVEAAAPDGTGRKTLAPVGAQPSWSPDGSHLVVDGQSLAIVSVPDGALTTIAPDGDSAPTSPEWSPAGTEVAFLAVPAGALGTHAIFVLSVNGLGLRELGGTRDATGTLAWSPDASQIAFYAAAGGDSRTLNVVRAADGGGRRSLTGIAGIGGQTSLAWQGLTASSGTTTTNDTTTTDDVTTTDDGSNPFADPEPAPPDTTPVETALPPVAADSGGVLGATKTLQPQQRTTVRGTARDDRIAGTSFSDTLLGRGGDDRLQGLAGSDRLFGGPGDDVLVGGPGLDELVGNAGADRFMTRDGKTDDVVCGSGRDVVEADRLDFVTRDCEIVHRSG